MESSGHTYNREYDNLVRRVNAMAKALENLGVSQIDPSETIDVRFRSVKIKPEIGVSYGSWETRNCEVFVVKGTETLYKVIVLREYDENGVLVAVGSETTPLPTGHTLKPTWDWVRAHG